MQYLIDLRQYVSDIAAIPRVSGEEARHLVSHLAAARQGAVPVELAAHAKERLIEGHLWLVVSLVKRSPARLCTLSPLDLVQEGTLGLLRAIERFDFAQAGNFTAYAATTIRYAILEALPMEDTISVSRDLFWRHRTDERVQALRALQPVSLDAAYVEDGDQLADVTPAPPFVLPDPATEEGQQQQAKRAQVAALLAQLSPREQQVLRLRYGLDEDDGRCHTPSAIARQLGLACSTVCHVERHALQQLRALAHPQAGLACHPRTGKRPGVPRSPREQAERRQEQVQRLEAACAELIAQGIPVCVRSLARTSHVDKKVIGSFVRLYWEQQGSEQDRLEAACAEIEAEGLPVTMARLCSRAHVGSKAAAAFLKDYHPVARPKQHRAVTSTRPAKTSAQDRLATAFAYLSAQGEKVTKARLRQAAGVGTDAAGAFLRAHRAGDAHPDLS
jgi:RNA polymerase sigma factor (sigma-70 family)